MSEFKKGDRVYVRYSQYAGFGSPNVTRVYKGKIVAQFSDGRWVVRESWTVQDRLVVEDRLAHR